MPDNVMTVSELSKHIKTNLEQSFPRFAVHGETSNFHRSHAGHWYWTLKDEESLISVVMFQSHARNAAFCPENGMSILVRGSISVYMPRGSYQIVCTSVSYTGDGEILLKLEGLKKKLANEGLFDQSTKKPLPLLPKKVAIITSPHGAAVQDVLRIVQEHAMNMHLSIAPALVQGEQAAETIIAQLYAIHRHSAAELIIICRGGGSLEDLLPFSDERLVRAIAASTIPIISAIGHETDTSLSDYAADYQAATPTAAAQILCAQRSKLLHSLQQCKTILHQMPDILLQYQNRLNASKIENLSHLFRSKTTPLHLKLDELYDSMQSHITSSLASVDKRLALCGELLLASDPMMTLKRGYAILQTVQGEHIDSHAAMHTGQKIHIQMHDGQASGEINETKKF